MKATSIYEAQLLEKLKNAVIFFDEEEMEVLVNQWLELGLEPAKAIFYGLLPGMEQVGKLYEDQVYFIPELLLCADTLYKGLEILKTRIKKNEIVIGKVLIGVVYGDIHDIGKNLVKMMLEVSGFEVFDMGRDVPLEKILKEVNEHKPDLLCLSAMMTTTMLEMRKMIKVIKKQNPALKVLVGGAPFTEDIAMRWGAHGFGINAHHALKAAIQLMKQIKKEFKA